MPFSNSIFNSAVVPYKDGFAGVFRVDDKARSMKLYFGRSSDGINWDIDSAALPVKDHADDGVYRYSYDPRVCKIDDKYYITWCNGMKGGPTMGVGYTTDFKDFVQLENVFLPCNRNGVLFPRKIKGNYMMLSRPSDKSHTTFGDILCSQSPDMEYWGRHRHVMGPTDGWQCRKIDPGPTPIETEEGWLMIYHGVLISCNGFVYSAGAALLDLEEPWKVKYRTEPYIISPQTDYECVGDVPNVVFPCAALADADTGRIAIYYGAADTVTALAFTTVGELTEFVKNNSLRID